MILLLLGLASFGLFWLISLLWKVFDKTPFSIAFRLPLASIVITLLIGFTAWLSMPELNQAPPPLVQTQKRCYESEFTWIMVDENLPCPPTPTPTPVKQAKQTSKSAVPKIECVGPDGVYFQTTQKECDNLNAAWGNKNTSGRTCYDPDGNVVSSDKCAAMWADTGSTNQPSYDYDYDYVPSYNYYAPSSYVSLPPPPAYTTYTPNYPTANITVKPMPTIGESKPIQNNCETFTTNAGSVTICK